MKKLLVAAALLGLVCFVGAQTLEAFDGAPWNISTGNLSVSYIQHCPMGAFPQADYIENPPSIDSLKHLKDLGLVAFEDYVGWGAVELASNQWSWRQYDGMEKALHAAGLKYVVYDWVNFPPLWLRNQPGDRTLMRCLEHDQETFYLSAFDPRTIEWYDHFYKNLHDHFGDKIDDVYACIMGPYGEGNYPLSVTSWVNMGHCHEGYWCGDPYAIKAFQAAMKEKYRRVKALNHAWGVKYDFFTDVRPPGELKNEKFKPAPQVFPTPQDKRRWLDFITWYHQALIDFAGESVKTVLKYFPAEKVRAKPGGTAAGVNPIAWGTYCPGYAKMAGRYHIVLQPADCQGAFFGDKWAGTAYQFYGVKEGTEPAGELNENDFVRRMFCDADCGAAQFFGYEFEAHATNMQKYVRLYTGQPGETQIAEYCPTTLYRLGDPLVASITAAPKLRDLCDFDVLDELLIGDGALKVPRYRALVLFQGSIIDRPILDKFDAFQKHGGKIITVGPIPIADVEGRPWKPRVPVIRVSPFEKNSPWRTELAGVLAGMKGFEGQLDGLWTCHRGQQTFIYNTTGKPVSTTVGGAPVEVAAKSIWISP
jgi:hypothetical protein